ncbi:MAG: hypothetical protein IKO40_07585, partial [Kiritimatiellae bacterium]|nr:hypothetical protein [Kiritimatiellia bacterium]
LTHRTATGRTVLHGLVAAIGQAKTLWENDRKQLREIIPQLCKRGVDVNATSWSNAKGEVSGTALHLAAYYTDVETLKALLGCGAKIDALDCNGENVLFAAAKSRNTASEIIATIQFLIGNQNSLLDMTKANGENVLFALCEPRKFLVFKWVVEHRADLLPVEENKQTLLLQEASEAGNDELVSWLETEKKYNNSNDKQQIEQFSLPQESSDLPMPAQLKERFDGALGNCKGRLAASLMDQGYDIWQHYATAADLWEQAFQAKDGNLDFFMELFDHRHWPVQLLKGSRDEDEDEETPNALLQLLKLGNYAEGGDYSDDKLPLVKYLAKKLGIDTPAKLDELTLHSYYPKTWNWLRSKRRPFNPVGKRSYYLLAKGDGNVAEYQEWLELLIRCDQVEKQLLKLPDFDDDIEVTILQAASKNGSSTFLRYLLAQEVRPSAWEALMDYAIKNDNAKALYFLWVKLADQRQVFSEMLKKNKENTSWKDKKDCSRFLREIAEVKD